MTLDHQRSNGRSSQVLHDRVRHLDLPGLVLVAVAVTAVHHQDLGKVSGAKQANGAFDGGGIEVGSGLAPTAEHEMSVGIAGGFQDGGRAFLGERREQVPAARGLDRVDGDLDVAVRAVLDADRHRQARRQLSVDLALRGAGADRAPTDEIGVELPEGGIEKLGAGGDAQLKNIGEQSPGEAQAFVDLVGLIYIRIVDESFPADDRARLLEVDAHDNEQRIGERVRDRFEFGRVFERGPGVVDGTRPDDYEEPRILAVEDRLDGTARLAYSDRSSVGQRDFVGEYGRREQGMGFDDA